MSYEGRIFRPPSEGRSLIIQATVGCSHNRCTFCTMYKEKHFRLKSQDEIFKIIDDFAKDYSSIDRVFIADGDAFSISTDKIVKIVDRIKLKFPMVSRISSYATPRSILRKTDDDLRKIYESGLTMLYMGIESGSDKILELIEKGVTSDEVVKAGKKAKAQGYILSTTLISGIGGSELSSEHSQESARVINAIGPDYVGLLTLLIENDAEIMTDIRKGSLTLMDPDAIVKETFDFIKALNVEDCIFRSNHASNYLALAGTLPRDKERLLQEIKSTMTSSGSLRNEKSRSL